MAKIAGAEQDAVEAGHGGDFIELFKRLGRFDLQNDHALGVRVTDIILHRHEAELTVDVAAVEGALADRIKADPVDNLAGFITAGDVGHDDACGIGFEWPDVVAVAAATDAHQSVDVVHAGGADLAFQSDPVVRDMFVAEPDGVGPAEPGDLGNSGVRQVDLEHGRQLIFTEELEHPAGAEFHDVRWMKGNEAALFKKCGVVIQSISVRATSRPPSSRLRRPAIRSCISSTVSLKGNGA